MGSTIDFRIGDIKTTAYAAVPDGPGPFPGVVVGFHKEGLDRFTEWVCDDLANNGYAAISPNHYHVLPPGMDIERRREFLTDKQLTADLKASADWLVQHGKCDASRLALLGHCMGGRTTWLGLVTLPGVFKCGCPFYGGSAFQALGGGVAPMDQLANVACPIMGFFGNDDKNPSPADMDEASRRLTALGKEHTFHRYDGTGHGFMGGNPKSFREKSARDSWTRALKFLKQNIGGHAPEVAEIFPFD